MTEEFKTYEQKHQIITPEDKVYSMYYQDGNSWVFKGIVSKRGKEYIQSDDHTEDLNKRFQDEIILGSFTGKDVTTTKKVYLFIPCPHAEVVKYVPTFQIPEDSEKPIEGNPLIMG